MPDEFAFGWFREALGCYEKAEQLSEPDDPDAILRWNTCARILEKHEHVRHATERMTHDVQTEFGDDVLLVE